MLISINISESYEKENNSDNDENPFVYYVENNICKYCGFYGNELKKNILEHLNEFCPWVYYKSFIYGFLFILQLKQLNSFINY